MGLLRRLWHWTGADEGMTNIVAGNAAPGFSLKTFAGKEYSVADAMKRGPVVLAFFKISCPVCQFTFPFLERLYERYGGNNVTFLGVSQDDARATSEFCNEYGVTFPVLLDEKNYPVSNGYGLTSVPTIFLVETDGSVKVSSTGFVRADLEAIAEELSTRCKLSPAPLFRTDEKIPANRPG
jgi:peroxiredoxin